MSRESSFWYGVSAGLALSVAQETAGRLYHGKAATIASFNEHWPATWLLVVLLVVSLIGYAVCGWLGYLRRPEERERR